jgi:hypothetical protein
MSGSSKEKKMSLQVNHRLRALVLSAGLILILSGCAAAATPPPPANPTVIVVQYVTQVVATVTPAPPMPTATKPAQSAVAPGGFDPYSVKPYYPVYDCPVASRLHVGDVAFVATGSNSPSMHISRNVGFAPVVRKLNPGELLYVTEEATCNGNGLVWGVVADSDLEKGFVLEGNGENYWILPFGQTFDPRELKDRKKNP